MAEIKKIQKELHKRKSKFATREHDTTYYNEWHAERDIAKGKTFLSRLIDRTADTRMRAVLIGAIVIGILVIVAIAIAVIVYFQRSFFMQEHVAFHVQIPQNIASNETVEIILAYENNNRAQLHDVKINVDYGQYFVPATAQEHFTQTGDGRGVMYIGQIDGHKSGTVTLVGHFIAPQNDVEDITATLLYMPERTSIIYTKKAKATTMITSSPLVLESIAEREVVSGNIVTIRYTLRNTSTTDVENLQVVAQYPDGFVFQKASPQTQTGSDHIWNIPKIPAHTSYEIVLQGIVSGKVGNVLRFDAKVTSQGEATTLYAENERAVRIVASPITITQRVRNLKDGIVYAGGRIEYDITIANESNVPLRDVIAQLDIDGVVVAYDEISLDSEGFYDQKKRQIIWKASDVPALAIMQPGDQATVSFILPIKSIIPIDGEQKKDFSVTTVMHVDSPDLPSAIRDNKNTASTAFVVRVGAKVLAGASLQHRDGPLPPRVGEKTTYDVILHAGVVNNDLKDASFTGGLQSGVSFVEQNDRGHSDLDFNRRTNLFTWNIGTMKHGTGVTTDPLKKHFIIDFTPSDNDAGSVPILMKNLSFDAIDTFTNKKRHVTIEDITIAAAQSNTQSAVQPRQAPAQAQDNTTHIPMTSPQTASVPQPS